MSNWDEVQKNLQAEGRILDIHPVRVLLEGWFTDADLQSILMCRGGPGYPSVCQFKCRVYGATHVCILPEGHYRQHDLTKLKKMRPRRRQSPVEKLILETLKKQKEK